LLVDGHFLLYGVLFLDRFPVGPEYELLDLLLGEIFLQIFDDLRQGLLGDDLGVSALIDEQLIGFLDVFVAVLLAHFDNHDFQKLLKIYLRIVKLGIFFALVQVSNQVDDLLIAGIKAKSTQYDFQIFSLNRT
jgi:hypothetical protein